VLISAALDTLSRNFRWVWDGHTQEVFDAIDSAVWQRTRNPFEVLRGTSPERLRELESDTAFVERVRAAEHGLAVYLAKKPAQSLAGYFCMEHGVAPSLRTYAGGLGILAGCIEKTAADLGVPIVAVGLMYRYWPRQRLSYGWQHEDWQRIDPEAAGLHLCPDTGVTVDLAGERVALRVWRAAIGRVDLYLLDTDLPDNPEHLRAITDRLYYGDKEHRVRQEMVLGVGGVRVLGALGLQPVVYHANEGHAGFMCLERMRQLVVCDGVPVERAVELVRAGTVFTTHTAMPAGFDLFDRWLIEKYFGSWADECGVSLDRLMEFGHFPGQAPDEPFNMAVLCAHLSRYINAVSRLHREITEQKVLGRLWPGRAAPVVSVTNGVHPKTWTPPQMAALFDRYVDPDWDYAGADRWDNIWNVPDDQLWRVRRELRAGLVDFVRWYLPRALREQGWGHDLGWAERVLDPDALTVVAARRAAEYKETGLLVTDPDRLRALLLAAGRPVNVLFAGNAHPGDDFGKGQIRRIVEYSLGADVRSNVVFLPAYDMRLALHLLAGADVWLNHPRRGDEACGTSFMKSVFAGGRLLTTADGGADELVVDGSNGWIIGDRGFGANRHTMAANAFDLLHHEIVPEFYDRDADGVPRRWVAGIKRSLATLAWQVSSAPMVQAYDRLYRDGQRRVRDLSGR
jgi:starch phosphorylase